MIMRLFIFIAGMAFFSQFSFAADSARKQWVTDTINVMCASRAPVLVVDKFFLNRSGDLSPFTKPADRERNMDLDGDGDPDGSHGDRTAAIVASTGKKYLTYNVPRYFSAELAPDFFANLVGKIERGEIERPSFINLSVDLLFTGRDLDGMGIGAEVNPDTIREKSQVVLDAIFEQGFGDDTFRRLHDAFARLARLKIPVVTASGNNYAHDVYNFFSLLPGVITVAALEFDGRLVAPYSNDNSLVDVYRIGHAVGRAVAGGIDFNGDEIFEVPSSILTGKAKVADLFRGQSLETVLASYPPKRKGGLPGYELDRLADGLYRIEDIQQKLRYSDIEVAEVKARGGFLHYPSLLVFKGTTYDPVGNGDPRAVIDFWGTSYAAPNICGGMTL